MQFLKWIEKESLTHAVIAEQLGVTSPYVSMLANQKRQPSLNLLSRITELTRGEVVLSDFLNE